MMTGCSLRLKTKTRSCASVATPATSPCVQPEGSCSQSGTSSYLRVLSPTSMSDCPLAGCGRLWDSARTRPVADVDHQALRRPELGLVIDVAQANGVELGGARGEQPLASSLVVVDRHADMLEAGLSRPIAGAQAEG